MKEPIWALMTFFFLFLIAMVVQMQPVFPPLCHLRLKVPPDSFTESFNLTPHAPKALKPWSYFKWRQQET